MNRVIKGWGLRMEFRQPELEELSAMRRAGSTPEAQRKLVRAMLVSPTLGEIQDKAPAAVTPLFVKLMEIFGLTAAVELLDEEDYDEPTAQAVVEAEKKGFRRLFVARFTPEASLGPALNFVLRDPRTEELAESLRDGKSLSIAKDLITRICVHGPLSAIDEGFPGLWLPLSLIVGHRVGAGEELTLEKA